MAIPVKPHVSVIIPTFDRAHCVLSAIESVLAQTYEDFELVVVDDGSSDATAALLAGIADPRLRVLRHERNHGAAAARNTGIRAARGRLIAFLDSDDVWFPRKLEVQAPALDAAPSGWDVSCTGHELRLLDHGVTRMVRLQPEADWRESLAMGCTLSPGSTQLTRREAFERVGFLDEGLPRFEDWDWLFRYSREGGVVVVEEPLACINNRRGRMGDALAFSTRAFLEKHDAALRELRGAVRRTAIADAWLQVVAVYGFEGRFGPAVRPFLRAFAVKPFTSLWRTLRGIFYVVRGRILRAVGSQSGTRQTVL